MITIKIAAEFFININRLIVNFIWKGKGTRITKTFLGKMIKLEAS